MESDPKKDEIKEVTKALDNKISISNEPEEEAFEDANDKEEATEAAVKSKTGEAAGLENLVEENDLVAKNMTWDDMGIKAEIKKGLLEMNFIKPSMIQSTTFPLIMKKPYTHLIAQAQNGAGKTGAFGLGVVSRIDEKEKGIQAIIFAHTRELVNQIEGVLAKMTKETTFKVTALASTDKNKEVGQIVVLTPGAYEKLFIQKKMYPLTALKVLVLDEADYMITNETTLPIVEKTIKSFFDGNINVQVLFFSATFSEDNFKKIKKYFKKANMIELKKESLTLKNVKQMFYDAPQRENKITFVEEYLKRNSDQERVIIFVNSRDYTAKLQSILNSKGYKVFILMGGDMDPKERDNTIHKFNSGQIQILITTNLLARGYDEKLVKLVINFDIPVTKNKNGDFVADPETYLHRIGRTGRFGTKGVGLSLISGDKDKAYLKQIEEHYQTTVAEIKSLDDLIAEFKKFLYNQY